MFEIERCQADLARNGSPWSRPGEPARHHQVNDHEQIIAQVEYDPLPDTTEVFDRSTLDGRKRRIVGPENGRGHHPDAVKTPTTDIPGKRFDVDHHIG